MELNVFAHFCYPSGLQQSALGLVKALRLAGVRLACREVPVPGAASDGNPAEFRDEEVFDCTLLHVQPEPHFQNIETLTGLTPNRTNYRIAYWYWEASRVPAHWAKIATENNIQEVWAASKFVAAALRAALPIPVFHLPPGVEICDFRSFPKSAFGAADQPFTFLFMFDMRSQMERKNPLGVIHAFQRAFRPDDPVQLIIRAHHGRENPTEWRQLNSAARQARHVVLVDRELSRAESYALISACDCYVSLHRAEGLGLTMAEAMLLGKPIIATAYSGNMDFMTPANSFLCNYSLSPLGPIGPYPADAQWATPCTEHAAELMRSIYRCPDEAHQRAALGRHDVESTLSPTAAAPYLAQRLERASIERYADMRRAIRARIVPCSRMSLPEVRTAYREELTEYISTVLTYPPGRFADRGIVLIDDGRRYDATYCTIRMFRHLGCTLPVQLWYLESTSLRRWQRHALEVYGVECINIEEVSRIHLDHWRAKIYAVTHCRFAEVLCSDVDDYPLRDPTFIFESPEYRNHGALFFADQTSQELAPHSCEVVGVPYKREPGFRPSPIFIDKRRCWNALQVVHWMNDHSDFYHPQLLAGACIWQMAWKILRSGYALVTEPTVYSSRMPTTTWFDAAPLWSHEMRKSPSLPAADNYSDNGSMDHEQLGRRRTASCDGNPTTISFFLNDLQKIRASRTVAIVLLGRNGDILLQLPAFHKLAEASRLKVITLPQYADLVKGLTNIEWVPFEGTLEQWPAAVELGKRIADEVIVSQVGHVPGTVPQKNFALDGWYRAGLPQEDFYRLPLVIENRDMSAERKLLLKHVRTNLPLILWCGTGVTTPFSRADEFARWLINTFEPQCEVLDLSAVKAPRIQDLLGLYERASVLISIDTATLHLGYATGTPTLAFLSDVPYGASEPRAHWVWWGPYSTVFENLNRIAAVVRTTLDSNIRGAQSRQRKPVETSRSVDATVSAEVKPAPMRARRLLAPRALPARMSLRFYHGLGDCTNFAHLIPLYIDRGYAIEVETALDKRPLFLAAGASITDYAASTFPWLPPQAYPPPSSPDDMILANKSISNISTFPLADIGKPLSLYSEYLAQRLDMTPHVSTTCRRILNDLLASLGRPLICVHPTGATGGNAKNIDPEVCLDLCVRLVDATGGTVILLDREYTIPPSPHPRLKHLARDIGAVEVPGLWLLLQEADLLIGVDSGPLHLCRLTDTPALGVWTHLHPAHYLLPRKLTLNLTGSKFRILNSYSRAHWNIVEDSSVTPDIPAILTYANALLNGRTAEEIVQDHLR